MPLKPEVADQLRRQAEFYFSLSNLPRDKFLLDIVHKEGNEQGWVDLSIVLAFARMRKLLGIESKKPEDVKDSIVQDAAEALRSAEALVISDDGKQVRRKEVLGNVEEAIADQDARSLFVTPFPYDATLEELTDFMKQYGEVLCVRMRRHTESKDFRGSIFVEFDSVEIADKVGAMSLAYANAPLKIMSKSAFKEEAIEKRHKRKNSPYNTEAPDEEDNGATEFTKGLIAKFTFKEPVTEEMSREVVRDDLQSAEDSGVEFVKYSRGNETGTIRFKAPEKRDSFMASLGDGSERQLGGKLATVDAVDGEDEDKYWKEESEWKKSRGGGHGGGGRGRGGGGRGGRGRFGGGQKRRRDSDGDRAAKASKNN